MTINFAEITSPIPLTEETILFNLLRSLSESINSLKLRGSYGTVGNENVDPQYVSITVGGPSYNSTANSNGYTFGTEFDIMVNFNWFSYSI